MTHSLTALALLVAVGGCAITVNQSTGPAKTPATAAKTPAKKPSEPKPKPAKEKPTPAKPTKPKPAPVPEKEPPKTPPPVTVPPAPEKPRDDKSQLIVPIRVPLEAVNAEIEKLLPKTESRDWARATKKGASPEVDVKYKVWRDPIQTSFSGKTLRVTVPLRYAANVRAKIKNPIGGDWIWLTKDETWGTKAKPQRVKVVVDLTLSVENDWKVKSVSKLVELKHGAPPKDDVCVKIGIDVCTPKETLTDRVRAEMNDYLVPRIEKALLKVDTEIEKALDLKKQANTLWVALQTPHLLQKAKQKDCPTLLDAVCDEDAWLTFQLSKLGMTPLTLHEDDLVVSLGFEGKLSTKWGKKPKVTIAQLPAPTEPKGTSELTLRTTFSLPKDELSDEIAKRLAGKPFKVGTKELKLGSLKLAMSPKEKSVSLTIAAEGAVDGPLTLVGNIELDEKAGTVRLGALHLDDKTEALLKKELPGFDEKEFTTKIRDASTFRFKDETSFLRKAITKALRSSIPGHLDVQGALKNIDVRELKTSEQGIVLAIEVYGALEVEYVP